MSQSVEPEVDPSATTGKAPTGNTAGADPWWRRKYIKLRDFFKEYRDLPKKEIHLMRSQAVGNGPFFVKLVDDFYSDCNRRHPRYWVIKQFTVGVALCELPKSFDEYFAAIEAAARRNYKKAIREGITFRRIDYNNHLGEIAKIRQSADVRQGRPMPEDYLQGVVEPCQNPASQTGIHDYPYFGVFRDQQLIAYAGVLLAGEACMIEHILGHAEFQSSRPVPLLIIELARYLLAEHPHVKFLIYGSTYGAGESLRRFKRKFLFLPTKVKWLKE